MQVYSKAPGTPRTPRGAIDVTRPSPFGNPFVVGSDGERGQCVELYREWIWREEQRTLRERMRRELAGHDLVCACDQPPCHAYVIIEVIESPEP